MMTINYLEVQPEDLLQQFVIDNRSKILFKIPIAALIPTGIFVEIIPVLYKG